MKKSIFCLALAAAMAAPISALATQSPNTDKNMSEQSQTNNIAMFNNIDLTEAQKELISAIENPFVEDFKELEEAKTRWAAGEDCMPDRCGGDPRFQSTDGEFDPVLHQRHQQIIDARVAFIQKMGEVLTPEQYDQFIKNLDSIGRVE